MNIAHVTPEDNLSLCDSGNFDFCLAHIAIKNKDYKKFFVDRVLSGRELYLDNGVWETGYPLDKDLMIELAIEMGATYVYAPDYMGEKKKTLDAISEFGDIASNTKGFNSKIIGVMQGKTREEWFDCALKLAKLPDHICNTIAVNTLFIEDMYEYEIEEGARRSKTRVELLMMIDRQLDRFNNKRFYSTGFGAPIDAQELPKFKWLIGVDTAIACVMASNDMIITPVNYTYFKPKGKVDKVQLTTDQVTFAKSNIRIINSFIRGGNPFEK